mmetsp:Transcript_42336/g.102688  ORF Transcript_42336/g.102688 Transcript_42336/m.102688 type:complete len:217 (+) Transcript_42336:662-1312(+)
MCGEQAPSATARGQEYPISARRSSWQVLLLRARLPFLARWNSWHALLMRARCPFAARRNGGNAFFFRTLCPFPIWGHRQRPVLFNKTLHLWMRRYRHSPVVVHALENPSCVSKKLRLRLRLRRKSIHVTQLFMASKPHADYIPRAPRNLSYAMNVLQPSGKSEQPSFPWFDGQIRCRVHPRKEPAIEVRLRYAVENTRTTSLPAVRVEIEQGGVVV